MNQKQTTTKEKRYEIRVDEELNQQIITYCEEHDCTRSEFAREAITEKIYQTSHTQTETLLLANKTYNLTLSYKDKLPKEYIKQLMEVLTKYE